MAIPRLVHLAVTACWLWRLTRRQDQQAPWRGAEGMHSTRPLTLLSCQRLHRALRRLVWPRMFAAFAPGADVQNTQGRSEPIFRITASPQDCIVIPRAAVGVNFCEGIDRYMFCRN